MNLVSALEWRGYRLKEQGVGRNRRGRWLIDGMLFPSDIRTIRNEFHRVFGAYPRLLHPKTFNEKLNRSKLFARRFRHVVWADKIAVRDYVRERIGSGVLNDLLWTGVDLLEARRLNLSQSFIVKASHGTGSCLMARDPDIFDWDAAQAMAKIWLSRHYERFSAEWQYRWIPPRLLIEALLPLPDSGSLPDYKCFCFHGRVKVIQVDMDRFTHHTRAFFDREGNRLDFSLLYDGYPGTITLTKSFPQIIEYAEALAEGEPFIRADFYDVGRPVFGEITLHPEGALGTFQPSEWDLRLGSWW